MKVPNASPVWQTPHVSLSRLQNEGSQPVAALVAAFGKSIKVTE
ncbi:hypothetical protein HMPREF0742_02688 [Rothia aeria F0184]|uniref:Uncharacterized protein n=1 Tax=Rothia aeria F0184 TaxID=888019 RepID=U7UW89_9MICC|nr:hypothetical protein HMPREF0742_02688 [Rothia aeria F0184]